MKAVNLTGRGGSGVGLPGYNYNPKSTMPPKKATGKKATSPAPARKARSTPVRAGSNGAGVSATAAPPAPAAVSGNESNIENLVSSMSSINLDSGRYPGAPGIEMLYFTSSDPQSRARRSRRRFATIFRLPSGMRPEDFSVRMSHTADSLVLRWRRPVEHRTVDFLLGHLAQSDALMANAYERTLASTDEWVHYTVQIEFQTEGFFRRGADLQIAQPGNQVKR